jgi:hypothetical protein
LYLRDTKAIQDKHLAALQSASSNVMALILGISPDDIVRLTATMSNLNIANDIVADNQMGAYTDEMDSKKIYFTSMNPILTFY